jgi:hypothetical protein
LDLIQFLFTDDISQFRFHNTLTWSGFWNTGIEELAFINGSVGSIALSARFSKVAWKTRFSLEVSGSEGYAIVNGRGRSDGPQTLHIGKRWAWMSGVKQIDSEICLVQSEFDDSIFMETAGWLDSDARVAKAKDGLNCEILRQNILKVLSK